MKIPRLIVGLLTALATNAWAQPSVQVPAPAQVPTLASAQPDKNGVKRLAILRGLDKVSGRAVDISAPAGTPVRFGSLTITMRFCYTVPPEERPETAAFVQIDDGKPGDKQTRMFSGWMFASTPALNGLEHPVYDVWVITCKTDEPAIAGNANPPAAGALSGAPADIPPPPRVAPGAEPPAAKPEAPPPERGLPANPSSR